MMQGDAYPRQLNIQFNGIPAGPDSFAEMELCIGDSLVKRLSKGEIRWSEQLHTYLFDLTQKDTLALEPGTLQVQLRVKTAQGEVFGQRLPNFHVTDAISEEVL